MERAGCVERKFDTKEIRKFKDLESYAVQLLGFITEGFRIVL
jgi:hypothetical protein